MITATKNGISGQFSEADWKSGVPQKKGWAIISKEKKTLPKEIIGLAFSKAKKELKPETVPEVKAVEPVETKPKTKKNDHTKSKNRPAGKRKP